MATTTIRRFRPTTPTDLWRLADQGARNGVRILTECITGERFATSASKPGTIYRLTAYSCTCKGFTYCGRCQHHSLLLARLGWLPDVDDEPEPPTPAALAACPVCDGRGLDPACHGHAGIGGRVWCPCPACAADAAPAATAARAVALIERMAAVAGDDAVDCLWAA